MALQTKRQFVLVGWIYHDTNFEPCAPISGAWPIFVFEECDSLAERTSGNTRHHTLFLHFYEQDAAFCSELLLVLTKYYDRRHDNRPTLREAMLELCLNKEAHPDTASLLRAMAFGDPTRIKVIPATKWDAIAAEIWAEHKIKVTGHTLCKSIYPALQKKRRKILSEWEPHLKEWRRLKRLE